MKNPDELTEGPPLKQPQELIVELQAGAVVTALAYQSDEPRHSAWLILAHGAGAGQRSPFMVSTAGSLAARGINVVTFNFEYTERGRRLPDRRPVLDACYCAVIGAVRTSIWQGRPRACSSAGSPWADGLPLMWRRPIQIFRYAAWCCWDIRFILQADRPSDETRIFPTFAAPMLIVQGERDTFGTPSEFETLLNRLSPRPMLHVVARGDHSFKVPRAGTSGQQSVYREVEETIVRWIGGVMSQT